MGMIKLHDVEKQSTAWIDANNDILKSNYCLLPSLEDSFVAHEFILDALIPHFEQITGEVLESCPVT